MPRRAPGINPRYQPDRHRWQYRTSISGRQKSFYGPSALQARRKGEAALAAFEQGLQLDGTVGEWLLDWLECQKLRLKPSSYRRYASIVKMYHLPHLGKIPLAQLTAGDVSRMEGKLTRVSPTTVRHIHVILGTALQAAVDQGRAVANPVRALRTPRFRVRPKVILSRAEVEKLLALAKGDAFEALYVLALTMGLREGELLALKGRDIDLARARLSVNGTVGRNLDGEWVVGDPKTTSARRKLPLPAFTLATLASAAERPADVLLFPSATGGLLAPDEFLRRHFYPLLRRAGLPQMRFHDLRHTAATGLIEDGVSLLAVGQLLGHASPAVTLNIYGHLTLRQTDQATAAMNARYPTNFTG